MSVWSDPQQRKVLLLFFNRFGVSGNKSEWSPAVVVHASERALWPE